MGVSWAAHYVCNVLYVIKQRVPKNGFSHQKNWPDSTSMKTKICPFCAKEIEEAATRCNHCNSRLIFSSSGTVVRTIYPIKKRNIQWVSWLSLGCGIISIILLFTPSEGSGEMIYGRLSTAAISLILGLIGVVKNEKGANRAMAMAGIVLGSISLVTAWSMRG